MGASIAHNFLVLRSCMLQIDCPGFLGVLKLSNRAWDGHSVCQPSVSDASPCCLKHGLFLQTINTAVPPLHFPLTRDDVANMIVSMTYF